MRFTLTYSGPLKASGDAKTKHQVRQQLHPQLKTLWATHPALNRKSNWVQQPLAADDTNNEGNGSLLTLIDDKPFATLVHPNLQAYAELDILLLRPEAPGAVVSHFGDIDNQLKTLFDALRRPTDSSEIPTRWSPSEDENPLHCLLEDDKLITRVNVETDRLLRPTTDAKVVDITIRVTVKGFTATWGNLGIIG